MRSKAIFMALLALSFTAQAKPVTQLEAQSVVRSWAARGTRLGVKLGTQVQRITGYPDSKTPRLYVVQMRNGGTIVVSADTDQEPILAFSPESVDLANVDPKSPLGLLLNARLSSAAVSASAPANWTRLLAANGTAPIEEADEIDDLRVAALLKTQWGQSEMTNELGVAVDPCFNYYTPSNAVCGCVATAMAQLMRYHQWPTAEIPAFEASGCTYKGVACDPKLKSLGGAYDWENMVETALSSEDETAELQCQAIGRLTYECGLSVNMGYEMLDGSGSGAVSKDIVPALTERFKYANAVWCSDNTGLGGDERVREKIVYAPLDAGRPVLFAIRGEIGGHAVVGDGYGYAGGASYVHLNMGWTGQDDWWYHFPDIDIGDNPESFTGFDTIEGAAYNVFAEEQGQVLSGRVFDEAGAIVAGATVKVGDLETVTSETGVYAFILTNGTYEIECQVGETIGSVYRTVEYNENSWGNDIKLGPPPVRIGATIYPSLNRAIEQAASGDVIEVLRPVNFWRTCDTGFDFTLVATNDNPTASPIQRNAAAELRVRGGTLFLTNVAFRTEASTPVKVVTPGRVAVAGKVIADDVVSMSPGILVDRPEGFVLAGLLENGLTLECDGASADGAPFGVYACDFATAAESAPRIVSKLAADKRRAGRADEDGNLLWQDDAAVDPAVAVARIDGETPAYYRTLDELFASCKPGDEIVLMKTGGTFSQELTVDGGLSIFADEELDEAVICPQPRANLKVTGGTLTLAGLTFDGYSGEKFLTVDGDGAAVQVADCMFSHFASTGKFGGVITVMDGSATVSGSTFENCSGNKGGAIYVAGGCTLNFLDASRITDCRANTYGGGIYANAKSSVNLGGGRIRVSGNASGSAGENDDIYLAGPTATLTLVKDVEGLERIGVWTELCEEGDAFAAVSAGVSDASASARAFFNDLDPDQTEAKAEGDALVWAKATEDDHQVDPDDARIRVIKGAETNYYDQVGYAFKWIDAPATVELLGNVTFSENLAVESDVILQSDSENNVKYQLTRAGDVSITVGNGASLKVSHVTLDGGTGTCGLLYAEGGAITLGEQAKVQNVRGLADRASGAVTVSNGSVFTLEATASIIGCENAYANTGSKAGYGGGLQANASTVYLKGGTISKCAAYSAGGAFIGNGSKVYVSGNVQIQRNTSRKGTDNLVVSDDSQLYLAGPDFTGKIGYNEGKDADTNVFGKVLKVAQGDAQPFAGTDAEALAAAHKFTHDLTGDVGMAVKNGDETLLVWGNALAEDGTYEQDGKTYSLVDGEDAVIKPPKGETFAYDGTEKTGLADGVGYVVVSGNVATDAGTYQAQIQARPGFSIKGDVTEVEWTITAVPFELKGVTFDDLVCEYDGTPKTNLVSGTLPDWLTVKYENNIRWEPGTNDVTATISGSNPNYEPNPFETTLTAKLIIIDPKGLFTKPEDPTPPPVQPLPVAFTAIAGDREAGTWTVTFTQAVEKCWYSLYETNSLTGGFKVEDVEPVARRQATAADEPAMSFTRDEDGAQLFWKVVAEPSDAHTDPIPAP